MPVTHSLRVFTLGLLLALAAPHSACSRANEPERAALTKQLSGVYVNETGVLHFHFSDGRVRMSGGIADFETGYEIEGDKLWITTADHGRKAMTIREDGSLVGELGVFTKKK
ncbi:MAG: hypothetical protein O7F08_12115 [Deltaproteobacteria bacterium]|nr:hypothetical protein [Deltaproteobacteria bacterium]